jgi:ribosomal protein L28
MITPQMIAYLGTGKLHPDIEVDFESDLCVFCNKKHRGFARIILDSGKIVNHCRVCANTIKIHSETPIEEAFNPKKFDMKTFKNSTKIARLSAFLNFNEDPPNIMKFDQSGYCPFCEELHKEYRHYGMLSPEFMQVDIHVCSTCIRHIEDDSMINRDHRPKFNASDMAKKAKEFEETKKKNEILDQVTNELNNVNQAWNLANTLKEGEELQGKDEAYHCFKNHLIHIFMLDNGQGESWGYAIYSPSIDGKTSSGTKSRFDSMPIDPPGNIVFASENECYIEAILVIKTIIRTYGYSQVMHDGN